MSAAPAMPATSRLAAYLLVAVLLGLVAAANWHWIDVAVKSQPDCVDHVRHGEGDSARGRFSAARSSCTPR
jgi:hypothetical protein